jgi:hypothetical protein
MAKMYIAEKERAKVKAECLSLIVSVLTFETARDTPPYPNQDPRPEEVSTKLQSEIGVVL